eukprot:9752709-Lingulodinium_polyedra.AAC.1
MACYIRVQASVEQAPLRTMVRQPPSALGSRGEPRFELIPMPASPHGAIKGSSCSSDRCRAFRLPFTDALKD